MLHLRPWLIVVLGLCGIVAMLIAAGFGYWQYANFVPEYSRAGLSMPVPNAYDDYAAAGRLAAGAGGASVLTASARAARDMARLAGLPGAPRGAPSEAYEEGVPLTQLRGVVKRNRVALARLRQGFGKACLNPPVLSFDQAFPERATLRKLAQVLVAEGKLAEREGRTGEAARSYLDALRLEVDLQRGGMVHQWSYGRALQAIALQSLDHSVNRLDARAALAAARELIRLEQQAPDLADALQVEKEATTRGLKEWLRTRDRRLVPEAEEGFDGLLEQLKFDLTPKRPMIEAYRAYMDAVIADARQPIFAVSTLPPPPENPACDVVSLDYQFLRWRWIRLDALQRIIAMRLAARAYQLDHGVPAPIAAALVPTYLPALPRDPYTNKPLVYRVKDGRALIYSRGPDGDDDGGRDLDVKVEPVSDGDIVTLEGQRKL